MEQKIVFVVNGELDEVNKLLADGWKVKILETSQQNAHSESTRGLGKACAYILLEK